MTNQFSQEILDILNLSKEEAQRHSSKEVEPDHLFLGLLRHKGRTPALLKELHIDTEQMKRQVEQHIDESLRTENGNEPLSLGEDANRILKLAILEARKKSTQMVDETHLLLAMMHTPQDNYPKEYLKQNNVDYDIMADHINKADKIRNGIDVPDAEEDDDFGTPRQSHQEKAQAPGTGNRQGGTNTPILDNFGTDLTCAAEEGKLDPVVGREKEITRITEILCRRKKNNPILIGEPGVGKTAIVEGLATQIAKKRTSPLLFGKRVVSIDLGAIVAGTKYRGQFEERIKAMVKEIEQSPDVIIFIDEIHMLIGAGSAPGTMDAANMLKPALSRGTIQCIGTTTLDEYRKSIEKDGALERRFQKIIVDETSPEETKEILNNIKERYESHHGVRYTPEAIAACVDYTGRYISDRQFPDKAIDALDEVGAKVRLGSVQMPPEIKDLEGRIEEVSKKKQQAVMNQNYELAASFRDMQNELRNQLSEMEEKFKSGELGGIVEVTEADVARTVSAIAGVPVQRVTETETARLRGMGDALRHTVIAQDAAIEKVVKAIQRNRVGIRPQNCPIGVFMFLGPTGVGKTYLAKKLAEYMFGSADALIRIDMSEYSESFNTSRLIGAPPGYVGYDEGGQLTERVRRRPYSIVLLDEIEKAHSNVFNMLLQVLDEGRLTDGNGRLVDFRNTIIIMTSNAGTRQLKDFGRGIGFNAGRLSADMKDSDKQYARSIIQKSLSKQFSPEFLNRLDDIITFDQLGLEAIKQIIDLELSSLKERLADLGYSMQLTDKAKDFVAEKGYDVQFGARPLKRAIQNYIEDGICELVLEGELEKGSTITIGKNPKKEELTFKKSI